MRRFATIFVIFVSGLFSGVIGSTFATEAMKAPSSISAISAAENGAWILANDGGVRFCWSQSTRTGSRTVQCGNWTE